MNESELERLERALDKRDAKIDDLRNHMDTKFDAVHGRITEVHLEVERKSTRWGVASGIVSSVLTALGLHWAGSK